MSTKSHLEAIASRRTIYGVSNTDSPIPQSRVEEIIAHVIKHTPSSYNIQSARAVIVTGESHKNLWANIAENVQQAVPKEAWEGHLDGFVNNFKNNAIGSVVWFEDQAVVEEAKKTHVSIAAFLDSWSVQSSGAHQVNGMSSSSPGRRFVKCLSDLVDL
jgi:uncharacterized protein